MKKKIVLGTGYLQFDDIDWDEYLSFDNSHLMMFLLRTDIDSCSRFSVTTNFPPTSISLSLRRLRRSKPYREIVFLLCCSEHSRRDACDPIKFFPTLYVQKPFRYAQQMPRELLWNEFYFIFSPPRENEKRNSIFFFSSRAYEIISLWNWNAKHTTFSKVRQHIVEAANDVPARTFKLSAWRWAKLMENRCNEITAGVKGKLFSLLEKA